MRVWDSDSATSGGEASAAEKGTKTRLEKAVNRWFPQPFLTFGTEFQQQTQV
jgi:hypothetical protein